MLMLLDRRTISDLLMLTAAKQICIRRLISNFYNSNYGTLFVNDHLCLGSYQACTASEF